MKKNDFLKNQAKVAEFAAELSPEEAQALEKQNTKNYKNKKNKAREYILNSEVKEVLASLGKDIENTFNAVPEEVNTQTKNMQNTTKKLLFASINKEREKQEFAQAA